MVGYNQVNMEDLVKCIFIFEQDKNVNTFQLKKFITLPDSLNKISSKVEFNHNDPRELYLIDHN